MVACGVVCAIALGLLAVPASFAGERELEEAPPPSSVEELFAVELEGFTSHRVNAPDSWDGTLLLGPRPGSLHGPGRRERQVRVGLKDDPNE